MPTGPVPASTVMSRHSGEMVARNSKGFSRGEVNVAGLPFYLARRWRLPMDPRRRSVLEGNVASIKAWAPHASAAKRVEGEVKRLEENLGRVEKEVKREAKKLEKDAVKAEKEVVAKVEAPIKARSRKKKTKSADSK